MIETATAACSVALLDGDAVVAAAHENVGRGHAERLLPMIAALPDGGRADAILVDCGPGSFTGIRVGIAAARALGLGWSVPVTGYSSLALVAARFGGTGDFVAAIPGGHGELFVQCFATGPLRMAGSVVSLTRDAARAFADRRPIAEDDAAFDAIGVTLLAEDLRTLPPRPIYGRAPDATPMA